MNDSKLDDSLNIIIVGLSLAMSPSVMNSVFVRGGFGSGVGEGACNTALLMVVDW